MNTTELRLTTEHHTAARSTRWTAIRHELATRREARAVRKQLERDLAGYTTQADLDDLAAVLDRYDDAETAAVRRVLNARRALAA